MGKITGRTKEFVEGVLGSVRNLSKDPSTKVGAIALENLNSKRILATGYNGFASGFPDDYDSLSRESKYSLTVHAEGNLVANASRNGMSLKGSHVVISEPPCPNCMAMLINSGVKRVFAPAFEDCPHYERWEKQFSLTKSLIAFCEIKYNTIERF